MDPGGSLLGPDDLIGVGEEHVAGASNGQAGLGQLLSVAVLGQERLQLIHGHLEQGNGTIQSDTVLCKTASSILRSNCFRGLDLRRKKTASLNTNPKKRFAGDL